jgi:hypothetical protein
MLNERGWIGLVSRRGAGNAGVKNAERRCPGPHDCFGLHAKVRTPTCHLDEGRIGGLRLGEISV